MSYRGFESDAAYFEIVAHQSSNAADRKELRKVASTYRSLANRRVRPSWQSRQDHWRKRAEECRTLSEQFKNEACRAQLVRLAETYELMAGTYRGDGLPLGGFLQRLKPAADSTER